MRTPLVIVKAIGKAAANYFLPGVAVFAEIGIDAASEIGDNAWKEIERERREAARREEARGIVRDELNGFRRGLRDELGELVQMQQQESLDRMRLVAREELLPLIPQMREQGRLQGQLESREAVEQAIEQFALYLNQIPSLVRQTMRRPEDPSGRSIRPSLALEGPRDIQPFVPTGAPRFRAGDQPIPGVDWVLDEFLGAGGMGEVWKARHRYFPEDHEPVALNFCTDEAARERLLKHEAGLCLRVQRQGKHPGIVALRQTYLGADPPCLEYEYVPGGDLSGLVSDWYARDTGPSPEQIARMVLQLCQIVGFGHKQDPPIVHRDIKPANILVGRDGSGKLQLKVADYGIGGIATAQARRATHLGSAHHQYQATAVRGAYSPNYASPEQMRGDDPSPTDDVHALGVLWYQLATGNLTRGRPGGSAWKRRLMEERGLSSEMVALMESCFEEAEERPPNALDLAETLEAILSLPGSSSVPAVVGEVEPPRPGGNRAGRRITHRRRPLYQLRHLLLLPLPLRRSRRRRSSVVRPGSLTPWAW